MLDELHDRLDPISAIAREDRVLSVAGGLPLHPLHLRPKVWFHCVWYMSEVDGSSNERHWD